VKSMISSILIAFALGLFSVPAAAQITSTLEASIPFSFTVVDTQLPAGSYTIRPLEGDTNAMEIRSADLKTAVVFLVGDTYKSGPSPTTELEFTKYGDREFLTSIFEEGTSMGARVITGQSESRMQKSKMKGTMHRTPAKKQKAASRK
jgi:hypothetical protein